MWIGDFVRGHTVVRVLKRRWPNRPVDLLTTSLCAPLVDYMPGVRSGIVWDLPRSRLALARQRDLAAELRARCYGTALVLPRTWKSALAPALAKIPERVGFFGEARFGLINRMRWGEKALPRFIDKNAALALPDGAPLPPEWPVPQLDVPSEETRRWRQANGLGTGRAVALAPGSVGASKRKRRGCWQNAGSTSGSSAVPAKRRWRRRSWPPADPRSATSPAPICATAFWRWRRPMWRSPTIPG
jgi:heptosyltransferase II